MDSRKVFAKYIPLKTSNDDLKAFFGTCGNLISVSLVLPVFSLNRQPSYMTCSITYETVTNAQRAIDQLNGKTFINSAGKQNEICVSPFVSFGRRKDSGDFKESLKKPEEDKELKELLAKKQKLEAMHVMLTKKNNALKEDIKVLHLQLKVKKLEEENMKLKGGKSRCGQ
ncbi:uncharacterized protein LOC124453730 [Xenia sp. Carnegie-2017]|uniref:uncharacterized protein LOC124453730 n=1 Tax=Xenia sp. Carnegie-2017 TaxID=2897299 RepID=UPI001F03A3C0|nr:uncharacterized protein LOC124453730 [Xenia sp. Carnegie-2017]